MKLRHFFIQGLLLYLGYLMFPKFDAGYNFLNNLGFFLSKLVMTGVLFFIIYLILLDLIRKMLFLIGL